ncbi:hypothetical protein DFP72DRAFT_857347 [Ephemerocybe angulata]|uniref:Uncharacterized protein n=1 Tax=Ephemerocybe angulata TaxID=980116 RepID=A0A8H6HCQ7_9AGAR|nr:hypothetical protein DFP72DRAFT_857347 [Tulosesus angulatus]
MSTASRCGSSGSPWDPSFQRGGSNNNVDTLRVTASSCACNMYIRVSVGAAVCFNMGDEGEWEGKDAETHYGWVGCVKGFELKTRLEPKSQIIATQQDADEWIRSTFVARRTLCASVQRQALQGWNVHGMSGTSPPWHVQHDQSQHALLAIGFFVVMILTVLSTLLCLAERGTWDEVMDTFINSDGDPTQFASIPAATWFVIVKPTIHPLIARPRVYTFPRKPDTPSDLEVYPHRTSTPSPTPTTLTSPPALPTLS